jgi:hypothetical protein
LAESSPSLTNYHYASNNPIMSNDPTGNCDPRYDGGCPVYYLNPDGSAPASSSYIEDGGGGGGNPGKNYSGDGIPSTSSSYGGTYNGGSWSGIVVNISNDGQVSYITGSYSQDADGGGIFTYDYDKVDNQGIGVTNTTVRVHLEGDANTDGSGGFSFTGWEGRESDYYDWFSKFNSQVGTATWGALISKVPELVRIGKVLGPAGAVAGELYDIYAVTHGIITPTHFAANATATLAGTTGILAPFSVAYFVLDAFYPGGVGGIYHSVSDYEYSQAHANDPPPDYQNTGIEDMPGWNR